MRTSVNRLLCCDSSRTSSKPCLVWSVDTFRQSRSVLLHEVVGPVDEVEDEEGAGEESATQAVNGVSVVVVGLGVLVSLWLGVLWEELERWGKILVKWVSTELLKGETWLIRNSPNQSRIIIWDIARGWWLVASEGPVGGVRRVRQREDPNLS